MISGINQAAFHPFEKLIIRTESLIYTHECTRGVIIHHICILAYGSASVVITAVLKWFRSHLLCLY